MQRKQGENKEQEECRVGSEIESYLTGKEGLERDIIAKQNRQIEFSM